MLENSWKFIMKIWVVKDNAKNQICGSNTEQRKYIFWAFLAYKMTWNVILVLMGVNVLDRNDLQWQDVFFVLNLGSFYLANQVEELNMRVGGMSSRVVAIRKKYSNGVQNLVEIWWNLQTYYLYPTHKSVLISPRLIIYFPTAEHKGAHIQTQRV